MARGLIIGVVVAVVFTVFSIIDCAVQPATRHRGVSKPVWIAITCIPVIGGILWFLIGRSRGSAVQPLNVPISPEDDPAFIRDLDLEAEERIRRLEEELRKLDEEETAAPTSPSAAPDGDTLEPDVDEDAQDEQSQDGDAARDSDAGDGSTGTRG